MTTEPTQRKQIISACQEMNSLGINQGTSGNISVRQGKKMLISPSAIPYNQMKPTQIASLNLAGKLPSDWTGPCKPSTEWRFHWLLLKEREDINAVVHAHPTYCTTLAILRKSIPSCHYMIAVFGGRNVRCADYATFGTIELANNVLKAMKNRTACIMANHGMVVVGTTLKEAMWRAVELETIARQYYLSLQAGKPVLLSKDDIADTFRGLAGYGLQEGDEPKK